MSKSTIIEKRNDEVNLTDVDIIKEPVVDLGQVDPVSIQITCVDKVLSRIQNYVIKCLLSGYLDQ